MGPAAGVGEYYDWYAEMQEIKRVAAYLECDYFQIERHPLRYYYCRYVSAAMAAEAEADEIRRSLAIK